MQTETGQKYVLNLSFNKYVTQQSFVRSARLVPLLKAERIKQSSHRYISLDWLHFDALGSATSSGAHVSGFDVQLYQISAAQVTHLKDKRSVVVLSLSLPHHKQKMTSSISGATPNFSVVVHTVSSLKHFYKMSPDIREKKKIRVKSLFYEQFVLPKRQHRQRRSILTILLRISKQIEMKDLSYWRQIVDFSLSNKLKQFNNTMYLIFEAFRTSNTF